MTINIDLFFVWSTNLAVNQDCAVLNEIPNAF